MGKLWGELQKLAQTDAAKEEAEEAAGNPISLEEVAQFFRDHPDPEDSEFHAWAESKGVNVHAAEEKAYQLASMATNFMHAGKANEKGIGFEDVDQEQLAKGINIEQEHSDDPALQARTALDHLAENPAYYDPYLEDMENKAKKELKLAALRNPLGFAIRKQAALIRLVREG